MFALEKKALAPSIRNMTGIANWLPTAAMSPLMGAIWSAVISYGIPVNGIMLWPIKTIPMMITRSQSR